MFETVTAARNRRDTEPVDDCFQRRHHRGDGSVPDDVEPGGDARFGARAQVRGDRADIQVGVSGGRRAPVGEVGVGLVQPRGA